MEGENPMQTAQRLLDEDGKTAMMNRYKASVKGSVTGLIAGVMYGYFKGKNIYVTGLVGMGIAGVATYLLISKK